jgi:hypothetical protein
MTPPPNFMPRNIVEEVSGLVRRVNANLGFGGQI